MPYDNSQRAVAAESTRAQVLAAAHELFLSKGFAATTDTERLIGSRHHVGHWQAKVWLREDVTAEGAAEIVWALNSSEPRWLLLDQGWDEVEFTRWLAETIRSAILA